MTISNPPECPVADLIRNGRKTVEGRVYDAKRRRMKTGDTIVFTVAESGETFRRQIKALRKYNTLEAYLTAEGYDNCLPGVSSFEEAVRLYNTGGESGVPWADPGKRKIAREETGYALLAIELI